MFSKVLRILIPTVVVLTVAWFVWPFIESSASQARHQQGRFVHYSEKRDWTKVKELMAADYKDQWKLNREQNVELVQKLLAGFILLKIEWTTLDVSVSDRTAVVRGKVKISGGGGGICGAIIDRVNPIKQPWVFTWRKEGWKPGDWKLLSVENKELDGEPPNLE